MTTHASLSPSAAKRWMACPGSIRLCKGIPRKSSVYADEGTAAHALAEDILRVTPEGEKPQRAHGYVGRYIVLDSGAPEFRTKEMSKNAKNKHLISPDMADAVNVYLDTVASLPGLRMIEQRVSAEEYAVGVFGTADAVVVDAFDTMYVCDYKHGQGVPVEAENNPQAMIYALGALEAFDAECETVTIIIVQPRADHPDGPVRRWSISADALRSWGREVLGPAAKRTEAHDAPVVAGDHCRFCPASAQCPATAQKALEVAQQEFTPAAIPPTINLPAPELMTDEQISKVLLFAQNFLSPWVKELEGYVQRRMEGGYKLPDWKLVRKRATRKWADEKLVEGTLSFLKQDIYDISIKSPAQMEKALKANGFGTECLQPLLAQNDAGLTIAHITDKRAAVECLPQASEFLDDDPAFD